MPRRSVTIIQGEFNPNDLNLNSPNSPHSPKYNIGSPNYPDTSGPSERTQEQSWQAAKSRNNSPNYLNKDDLKQSLIKNSKFVDNSEIDLGRLSPISSHPSEVRSSFDATAQAKAVTDWMKKIQMSSHNNMDYKTPVRTDYVEGSLSYGEVRQLLMMSPEEKSSSDLFQRLTENQKISIMKMPPLPESMLASTIAGRPSNDEPFTSGFKSFSKALPSEVNNQVFK